MPWAGEHPVWRATRRTPSVSRCCRAAMTGEPSGQHSHVAGADLMVRLSSLLYNIGSPKAFDALLAKRDVLPPTAFGHVLYSALRTWPPDKVYKEFAPLLEQKKGAGKEKSVELERVISAAHFDPMVSDGPDSDEGQALKKVEWDARWLDAAIKADQQTIVCFLARP